MVAAGGSNTFAGGLANAPYYIVVTDGAGNVIGPATAANQASVIANLATIIANQTNGTQTSIAQGIVLGGALIVGGNGITTNGTQRVTLSNDSTGRVAFSSQYPAGAIPVVAAGTGTTGAVTATLPAAAGKTTYICGFTIMAAATSLATGTATLAGLVGGVTFTYDQTVAAAANGTSKLTETFAPGIPASGTNTGIVVTSAAAGIGGVTDVNVWGYQL